MTSPLRIAILGGATTLALSFASVAEAQTTPPIPEPGWGAGEGHGAGMGHRGGEPERAARRLRDVLQLTPAQEPALQAFIVALHPAHDGQDHPRGDALRGHAAGPSDPAARRAEMEKRRADEAALTTPQRSIAWSAR